ncbi:MAG: tyrosine-type recombinase/integrase [Candidatus Competibacteraceae bacterium]|nr:MAG: tyrosine-type recombinase/integrase [Candidatus Competibacteraceae bacterium]
MKFTDRYVLSLKPKATRYDVWDGSGLGVRVSVKGRKSWVMIYRFQGKPRYATLGTYPEMSVAQAHEAHRKALAELAQGTDPGAKVVQERQEDRHAPTVAVLAAEYLEKWVKKRNRAAPEIERILNKEVLPKWGHRKAREITRREVIALLDSITERGPIMANQTLAVIRKMFNFGVDRAILESSPCVRVKAPGPLKQRERVLSDEELKTLWDGLDRAAMAPGTRLALKLQLATAQRKGEVALLRWEQVDWNTATWTIPGETAKNGKAHCVPLSPLALDLLRQAKELAADSVWAFPSPRNNGAMPMGATAADHAMRKALPAMELTDATPRDLRRTAASHMTGLGIPRLVVAKILNHTDRSVTAIYDRHSYGPEKRDALEKWARKLRTLLMADDVIRLRA